MQTKSCIKKNNKKNKTKKKKNSTVTKYYPLGPSYCIKDVVFKKLKIHGGKPIQIIRKS